MSIVLRIIFCAAVLTSLLTESYASDFSRFLRSFHQSMNSQHTQVNINSRDGGHRSGHRHVSEDRGRPERGTQRGSRSDTRERSRGDSRGGHDQDRQDSRQRSGHSSHFELNFGFHGGGNYSPRRPIHHGHGGHFGHHHGRGHGYGYGHRRREIVIEKYVTINTHRGHNEVPLRRILGIGPEYNGYKISRIGIRANSWDYSNQVSLSLNGVDCGRNYRVSRSGGIYIFPLDRFTNSIGYDFHRIQLHVDGSINVYKIRATLTRF